MNILLCDDHPLLMDGLSLILGTVAGVDSVISTPTSEGLFSALSHRLFDVLFLDIHLAKDDGRQLIPSIKKIQPSLYILALTSLDDAASIQSAIRAGYNGYLLKSDGRDTILEALAAAAKGEQYLSPATRDKFVADKISPLNHELTSREQDVLNLIVAAKTTKEIAATLFISEKTVETHRGNLMLKLDVKNLAGMVRKAILTGLVSF